MSISFKEQCIALRLKDKSINDIVKITGRSKSSVYFHVHTIPLSAKRLAEFHAKSGARIRQFSLARRGKSARAFKTFNAWTPYTALLIGHLLFDGEVSNSSCVYNNRSMTLLAQVEELMKIVYDFEPARHTDSVTGVHRISYHNVALAAYIQKRSRQLLTDIRHLTHKHKKAFLQAFFDDEGCMDYRPQIGIRKIRGYQKNVRILRLICHLLADFGIAARIQIPNEVVIVGKEHLIRFQQKISFSAGVRINGSRTNSRWKKHLEKRELLRRAIASFKT